MPEIVKVLIAIIADILSKERLHKELQHKQPAYRGHERIDEEEVGKGRNERWTSLLILNQQPLLLAASAVDLRKVCPSIRGGLERFLPKHIQIC